MFATKILPKNQIKVKEIEKLNELAAYGHWSLMEKVSIACRVLASEGHCRGLSGQISALRSDENYLTQCLGRGFDEASVSTLLTVDRDLNVISGEGIPNPANRFHSWVYEHRPDVRCVIHMHSKFASIIAMTGMQVEIAHMDVTCLFEEINYLDSWPGIPVGNEEGEIICQALGGSKALLLANHGYIIAGSSVEEAMLLAMRFEYACELTYRAKLIGDIKAIDIKLAREAKSWTTLPRRLDAHFSYHARRLLQADLSCLD